MSHTSGGSGGHGSHGGHHGHQAVGGGHPDQSPAWNSALSSGGKPLTSLPNPTIVPIIVAVGVFLVMGIPFIMNIGGMEPGRAEEDAKAEEVASRAQGQDAQIMQSMPGQPQGQLAGQMQGQMAPQQRRPSPFPGHTNRLSPTFESAGPEQQGQEQPQQQMQYMPQQAMQQQMPQQQMQYMPQQAMQQQMPQQQMQYMPQQAMQQQMPQQQMQYGPQPQYAPNPGLNAAYVQSLPPVGELKSSYAMSTAGTGDGSAPASYGGGHAQKSSARKFKVIVDR